MFIILTKNQSYNNFWNLSKMLTMAGRWITVVINGGFYRYRFLTFKTNRFSIILKFIIILKYYFPNYLKNIEKYTVCFIFIFENLKRHHIYKLTNSSIVSSIVPTYYKMWYTIHLALTYESLYKLRIKSNLISSWNTGIIYLFYIIWLLAYQIIVFKYMRPIPTLQKKLKPQLEEKTWNVSWAWHAKVSLTSTYLPFFLSFNFCSWN